MAGFRYLGMLPRPVNYEEVDFLSRDPSKVLGIVGAIDLSEESY